MDTITYKNIKKLRCHLTTRCGPCGTTTKWIWDDIKEMDSLEEKKNQDNLLLLKETIKKLRCHLTLRCGQCGTKWIWGDNKEMGSLKEKKDQDNLLFKEMTEKGIKFDRKQIIWVEKFCHDNGRITFCEQNAIDRIFKTHQKEFEKYKITKSELPFLIKDTLMKNKIIGYQNERHATPRPVYEALINGRNVGMAITVSENGYIVGANLKGTI